MRQITRPLWYHNVQPQTSLALLKICELLSSSAKRWPKINSTIWIKSPEIMGKGRLAGYLLTGHELSPQTLMEALLGFNTVWNPSHSFTQWINDANASLSSTKKVVAFVNPFTSKTYRYTNVQTSLNCAKNLFQGKTWKTKIPGLHLYCHRKIGTYQLSSEQKTSSQWLPGPPLDHNIQECTPQTTIWYLVQHPH